MKNIFNLEKLAQRINPEHWDNTARGSYVDNEQLFSDLPREKLRNAKYKKEDTQRDFKYIVNKLKYKNDQQTKLQYQNAKREALKANAEYVKLQKEVTNPAKPMSYQSQDNVIAGFNYQIKTAQSDQLSQILKQLNMLDSKNYAYDLYNFKYDQGKPQVFVQNKTQQILSSATPEIANVIRNDPRFSHAKQEVIKSLKDQIMYISDKEKGID